MSIPVESRRRIARTLRDVLGPDAEAIVDAYLSTTPPKLPDLSHTSQRHSSCITPAHHTEGDMDIDRMRVAAVRLLQERGFSFSREHGWTGPDLGGGIIAASDEMHTLLMARVDALAGCVEDSNEEAELIAVTDALASYELRRWPDGKVPGGKG